MPPRHGKSELATKKFPAWCLGKDPTLPFIQTSYSAGLAEGFGQDTKDILQSEQYKTIFPEAQLRKDSKSKGNWQLTKGGSYMAVGIGGPITGRGARIAVIDDPLKNRQEAESETYRDMVWNWYTSTLYTRLEGYGAVIVIQTRWHYDDLVGRLLEQMEKDKEAENPYDDWTVINFPAIADEDEYVGGVCVRKQGDPLWPQKFDVANLQTIRQIQGVYDWSALYQQEPISSETQEFRETYFRYFEDVDIDNKYVRYYTTVDPAISQNDKADNTVVLTCAKEVNGPNIYRVREDAGHFTPKETVDLIFKHNQEYDSEVGIEMNAYQKSLHYYVQEEQRKRQRYFTVREVKSKGNKEERIRGLIPMYEAGVVFHRHSDAEYEREALTFPAGKHDDRLDAMAMQIQILDSTRSEAGAKVKKPKLRGYFTKSRL